MKSSRIITALFFFISILSNHALSQVEHVPVSHPVYDFFDRMNIKGILPQFSRAVLPIQRKEAAAFIDSLQTHRSELSETETELLARFTDEFVDELHGTEQHIDLFGSESLGNKLIGIFSDKQKYLYSWRDSSTTFYMEFLGSGDYRTVLSGNGNSNVFLGQVGGRFRGTMKSFLGYSLQGTNGTDFGSKTFALTDRVLRQNANFGDFGNSFFDFAEAYLSADFGWGKIVLGRERFLVGNGIGTKLVLSNNPPTFDALRIEAHIGNVRYMFAHSSILSQKQMLMNGEAYYDPKFFAMHRAEALIADAVRFGVFECMIYAKRFVDLAYINPINFFASAEHALGDRDNKILGFDLSIIPIHGLQCYGTWLIDDIDFKKFGTSWWGNKFGIQGGIAAADVFANTDIICEYTRVEPYTFSHFFPENTYTHKDYVLGTEVPPNGDEISIKLRHWIGAKFIGTVTYQYDRHANNIMNADGTLLRNVGGNALVGFVGGRDRDTAPFLDGDRTTQNTVTCNARYEIWRNIILDFIYRYRFKTASLQQSAINDHFLSLLLDIIF